MAPAEEEQEEEECSTGIPHNNDGSRNDNDDWYHDVADDHSGGTQQRPQRQPQQKPQHDDEHHDVGPDPITQPQPPVLRNTSGSVHHRRRRRRSFLKEFATSKGAPQIVVLCLLLSLGIGSTIGVVPAVMSDRYARLNHGYTGEKGCDEYDDAAAKPKACFDGSSNAQNAVAMQQLVSNGLTFFTSSFVGSLSDEYGRRGFLLLAVFLFTLSPLTLVLIQLRSSMSPMWYYAAGCSTGAVSFLAVALSSLSDVMPPDWRAPSFGLLLSGFSLGIAMAPQLAIALGHFRVSVLALSSVLLGLLTVFMFFPETLSRETAAEAKRLREQEEELLSMESMDGGSNNRFAFWSRMLLRPVRSLSIINRNSLFRLLSVLAFFSGMVSSGDQTLLVYYVEERLNFSIEDVAKMFTIVGLLGIFVQGVMLKLLNELVGERLVVVISFTLGTVNNLLYGLAHEKVTIFIAMSIGSFVMMALPTISAIKSNNVEESEQGRIQGALYSLSALANALGPLLLRAINHYTKDGALLGPGTMFVFAAGLYVVAVAFACALPPDVANSKKPGDRMPVDDTTSTSADEHEEPFTETTLEEPLL